MHNLQTHTDALCTIYKYPRARCTFYKHTRAHCAQFTRNLKQRTRTDRRGRPQHERKKRGRSCFGKTEKCISYPHTLSLSLSHTHTHVRQSAAGRAGPSQADKKQAAVCFVTRPLYALCTKLSHTLC